jgi:hypothetical protein
MSYFSTGSHIILREHWNNKVWTVRPVTVVADVPDVIALYMMPDTTCKHPCAIDGSPVPHFLPDEWLLIDRQWQGGGALYLSQPGQWYAIMGLFEDNGERIEQWYINLQTPYQRTPLGFDYLDQELDIIVNRNLTSWHWKDEEKFLNAQRRRRISIEQAEHVRHVGENFLQQLQTGGMGLTDLWRDWQPPKHWHIPSLPDTWCEAG